MRPLSLLGLLASLGALILATAAASADAGQRPICLIAPSFELALNSVPLRDFVLGASVIDLRTGEQWTGGLDEPFAMHSVIKPAVAAAVLQDSYEQGWTLKRPQKMALNQMVERSANADVRDLLGLIGDMPGLVDYYHRWGLPDLEPLSHNSWGASRASPSQLARLFAALAVSDQVPVAARGVIFSLLDDVPEHQIWGTQLPSDASPGWQSLIKTGNYSVPAGPSDSDIEEAEALNRRPRATPATPLAERAMRGRILVRMNSAAIWLSEPWSGGEARYVVAIMIEGFITWQQAWRLQNQFGSLLADAIVARERAERLPQTSPCLRRALA